MYVCDLANGHHYASGSCLVHGALIFTVVRWSGPVLTFDVTPKIQQFGPNYSAVICEQTPTRFSQETGAAHLDVKIAHYCE